MALATGTRLGAYEILSLLGAGGMGEVYRARDSKLNRDVAIKVLPELFTADADRLARFRREAQVLASLNHPNIGHIYGLEDSGAMHALVLELVEGPTLADRIAQGAIPLEEALPIARQVADGLECAHELGIVHRDLKPANIKVREDGTVKVLDFGLAKALEAPGETGSGVMNSPTLTARATQMGLIMGTAAYMAPEQARGRTVDRRADIWAFGVVLYEMLTGKRAFEGEDISVTLAKVLRDDVVWSDLPADLPPPVRRLLRRSLEKDPKRRLGAICDARLELDDATEEPTPAKTFSPPARRWRERLAWTFAGLAAAAALTSLVLWKPWRTTLERPARVSADFSLPGPLAVNLGPAAVISPDGQTTVFVVQSAGRNMLYIRRLEQLHSTLLPATEDAHSPFFSPDSQWIGFFTADKLKKISVAGGAALTLCDARGGRGGSWGTDGTIVFQPSNATGGILQRVPEAGGAFEPIGKLAPGEITQRWPQVLPGGKAVLYSGHSATIGWDQGNVMAQPLSGGEPKVILRGAFYGRYINSGHLLYLHRGTLFSVRFDPQRLELRGTPAPVVEQVLANINTGGAQFSISDAGTLLYVPGKTIGTELPITWVHRSGKTEALRAEPAEWTYPAFSPDGTRLAFQLSHAVMSDVWIYEWTRDRLTQLTFGNGPDQAPVWTPDGRRIAFASGSNKSPELTNLYWKRSDGSGQPERLTESPHIQIPYSFHPSGKYLAFTERRNETGLDIMILPLEGDEKTGWKPGKPTAFLNTTATENHPAFSPDGRWLAYVSADVPSSDVYVRPFPAGDGTWKVSIPPGGFTPLWSRARQELFYLEPVSGQTALMSVMYEVEGGSFRAERPRRWYSGLFTPIRPGRLYDVHPDGARIAIGKLPDVTPPQEKPVFVFNFLDELRRVMPLR